SLRLGKLFPVFLKHPNKLPRSFQALELFTLQKGQDAPKVVRWNEPPSRTMFPTLKVICSQDVGSPEESAAFNSVSTSILFIHGPQIVETDCGANKQHLCGLGAIFLRAGTCCELDN